jgi:hypothetical protein
VWGSTLFRTNAILALLEKSRVKRFMQAKSVVAPEEIKSQ